MSIFLRRPPKLSVCCTDVKIERICIQSYYRSQYHIRRRSREELRRRALPKKGPGMRVISFKPFDAQIHQS